MPATYRLQMKFAGKVITSDRDRPEWVTVRDWRTARHNSQLAMAQKWHKEFLPLHFQQSAASRYQGVYKKRAPQYLDRKRKKYGSAAYLVFTGNLQRLSRTVSFRSFPSRFRISLPGTRYTFRKPPLNQPNIHSEMTAVNPSELKTLKQVGQQRLADDLNRLRKS